MNWYNAESAIRPADTDTESSEKYNYIRRNIAEVERDQGGEIVTMCEYEECKIPKEAWGLYTELEQTKADIDYLNMITEEL